MRRREEGVMTYCGIKYIHQPSSLYIEIFLYKIIYTFLPPEEGGVFCMGEALIARGLAMDPDKVVKYGEVIKTEIITNNTIWQVPGNCIINKGISVRIFGGGGGYSRGGGGGGYMNNAILTNLNIYDRININIGAGGSGSGGTTYFGKYLSANGGQQGTSGGGSGGSGGGGSGFWSPDGPGAYDGGDGYQFGGGGGGHYHYSSSDNSTNGGNGGKWGGGGGGTRQGGNGGEYGGNGGGASPKNGTNIFSIENLNMEDLSTMEFKGIGSLNRCGGGGGYGGCGGYAHYYYDGYGGHYYYGGGGGGGYGANGGNGYDAQSGWHAASGGGGGGYGGKGADASRMSGGGGGGYGSANYGAGGGGKAVNGTSGMHGVCIIQYYVKELV